MLPTAQVLALCGCRTQSRLDSTARQGDFGYLRRPGLFCGVVSGGSGQTGVSYEKNPDVIWLRSLNPGRLKSAVDDADRGRYAELIALLPGDSVDAILHDPPRFGIAGELYSQVFYNHLARVLKRKANCSITPAPRTNSPAAAMCPTKYRNVFGSPGSAQRWTAMACWQWKK